jgi:hypothetical protein
MPTNWRPERKVSHRCLVEGTRRFERIGIHRAETADRQGQRVARLPSTGWDGGKPAWALLPKWRVAQEAGFPRSGNPQFVWISRWTKRPERTDIPSIPS